MDSLSQMALGAALAHATLGERLGKKALIVGAALGTLPDLDVLIPYADAIDSFTLHRSWSHSLFVLTLLSVPIAWLLHRLLNPTGLSYPRVLFGTWLILFTHPLLDAFTVYGTQIFWPLSVPPAAWGSVFIIDPAYTLPLITGLVLAWRWPYRRARHYVSAALALSTVYLAWTLVAQHQVRQTLLESAAALNIQASHIMVAPLPLSLMWRTLVVTDDGYYEGYRSLFDNADTMTLAPHPAPAYPHNQTVCTELATAAPVQRMDWFTGGFFALSIHDDQLILSDLRMGIEDSYVFRFTIATRGAEGAWDFGQTELLPVDFDTQRARLGLQRLLDESVDLSAPRQPVAITVDECDAFTRPGSPST